MRVKVRKRTWKELSEALTKERERANKAETLLRLAIVYLDAALSENKRRSVPAFALSTCGGLKRGRRETKNDRSRLKLDLRRVPWLDR